MCGGQVTIKYLGNVIQSSLSSHFSGTCSADEYRCKSGQCIPGIRHCDGVDDCSDGDDEENCDNTRKYRLHLACDISIPFSMKSIFYLAAHLNLYTSLEMILFAQG